MGTIKRITPFLWFADQAEEAAKYYVSIFKNSKIVRISRYPNAGQETHGRKPGSVMVVEFELDGQPFKALNGGPAFTFNEAVSLEVGCDTQEELDHYWEKLKAGGDPKAQQCGWLKDKYGLSWQVVPAEMGKWFENDRSESAERVMEAVLDMKKLDIAELKRAYAGAGALAR